MKNPLFQVISPTTALVTNSSHIICYVLEHIRGNNEDPRCPHKRASGILFIVAALRCLLVHTALTGIFLSISTILLRKRQYCSIVLGICNIIYDFALLRKMRSRCKSAYLYISSRPNGVKLV